jgi:hypothetical protein
MSTIFMSTICMKLDPGIHIGMHLVCFSKTRCDKRSFDLTQSQNDDFCT